ncbi:hypothetical protein BJ166DRAFT_318036 [Pestalotiopsis sp. NC0098]|nr:hypothetical protein BJ166DRAFT_318036 [Pestalotiopsis sp. NC0098]
MGFCRLNFALSLGFIKPLASVFANTISRSSASLLPPSYSCIRTSSAGCNQEEQHCFFYARCNSASRRACLSLYLTQLHLQDEEARRNPPLVRSPCAISARTSLPESSQVRFEKHMSAPRIRRRQEAQSYFAYNLNCSRLSGFPWRSLFSPAFQDGVTSVEKYRPVGSLGTNARTETGILACPSKASRQEHSDLAFDQPVP